MNDQGTAYMILQAWPHGGLSAELPRTYCVHVELSKHIVFARMM